MKLHLCLLGVMLVAMTGCDKQAFPPAKDWITFDSPDAPYSVLLPSKPVRQEQTSDGITVVLHTCQINKDLGVITGSNDMPKELNLKDREQIKFLLDQGMNEAVAAMKSTIKEQKDITVEGKYPGRECTATIPLSKSSKGIVRLRYVLIPGSLIQVIVVGDEKQMSDPLVTKCLESVKINKKK